MELISLNVGIPRVITYHDQSILTGIFKSPVEGPVVVRKLNIDGDRQADLTVHGGEHKAVYAYPSEHYPFWRQAYPHMHLPWGSLGENLTTRGLAESSVHVGDQLRIGDVILQVTQPRMPCYKLAAKFQDDGIGYAFLSSGLSGFYFSVVQEGTMQPGDAIEIVHRDLSAFTISDALKLYLPGTADRATLKRALATSALPPGLQRRAKEQFAAS